MAIDIQATTTQKIGFASHQNAVPILRELALINSSDAVFENLQLELTSNPAFTEPKKWLIDRVPPQGQVQIAERHVKLNGGLLRDQRESERGNLRLVLRQGDDIIAEREWEIEVLGRHEWGGAGSMPELLASFCMPNDAAVDKVLKTASEALRRMGRPDGIDGYKAGTRTRPWELASAIWAAIVSFNLGYALPGASFEEQGQKVRSPSRIIETRVATCLDTALLFAAALEQAGLNPLVLLTRGHAFAGVWLEPQQFGQLLTEDAMAVRKRVAAQELVVFETTLATHSPAPTFSQAIAAANRQIAEEATLDFFVAVDIKRARMQRILPLNDETALPSGAAPAEAGSLPPVELAPALPPSDLTAAVVEASPGTAATAGKILQWQRRLLDLTTRNRLLHLGEAKTVRLICPDPSRLEDLIAAGKKIRIAALPDLEAGGRDKDLYFQTKRADLQNEYAEQALDRGEAVSSMEKPALEAALIELYRKAKSDMVEGGANTLFLALGCLKWKKSATDEKTYRAPLILLPIRLDRKSAVSGVVMAQHEDEPRFNLTLLELLKQDFALTIPGLSDKLPADASGIDVAGVWSRVRNAVRDMPGFEVTEETLIGTFSFAKYLMWKDLVDRSDQLTLNPVVKHLLERRADSGAYCHEGDFPRPETLDRTVDPARLFAPLPADSSQLAAVVASANGCDFVLDGPPGTGKSQTIANIIAHNLAVGRRVLFVAEKRAALDVVYRRLEAEGLGPFCLELHSNKAGRVDVLRQLDRAWQATGQLSEAEWLAEAATVRRLRDDLNATVAMLHQVHGNGWTLHRAIGTWVRDGGPGVPDQVWPSGTVHDAAAMARLRDAVQRLALNFNAIHGLPRELGFLNRLDWSNAWQDALAGVARQLPERLDATESARAGLLQAMGLDEAALAQADAAALLALSALLAETYGVDLGFAFAADYADRVAAGNRAVAVNQEYRDLAATLSAAYAPDRVAALALSPLDAQWARANEKFWLLASRARKQTARALAMQAGLATTPAVGDDLGKLHRLQALMASLESLRPQTAGLPGIDGLQTDAAAWETTVALARQVRDQLATLAGDPAQYQRLQAAIRAVAVDGNALLRPGGPLALAAAKLQQAAAATAEAVTQLESLGGQPYLPPAALRAFAFALVERQAGLNAWCGWCRARQEALALGLAAFVSTLETSQEPALDVARLFEIAYARWFALAELDATPALRNFVSVERASEIVSFRLHEENLAKLAVRYARAKLSGGVPRKGDQAPKNDGFGMIRHQLQLTRPSKTVREMMSEGRDAITKLAPCMLMSPLSIAQYLPADQSLFDLVIFDEASQITPWDAIGAIARGKQVIVCGDPKQMPPTSFFARGVGNAADDVDVDVDMESILDECLAAGVPNHRLTWHYRSRHENLIAFSNSRYYGGELVTFPAPVTQDRAVSWRRVPGVYVQGKATNQIEAEALVAETVARLRDPAFAARQRSLMVVTFNANQQELVENLLDAARRRYPEIEPFFSEDLAEPVVVKNLETVQGDQRDVVLIGVGFGPTEPGGRAMSMNFGPLNKEGGKRRLNVALTRAQHEMVIFTSFDPGMIDLSRTSAEAVRDLKHFIEFAERGPRALAEAVRGSVGGHDSPFEEAVCSALSQLGWQVVPQIGVSRFRIDLGIVHPDRPGDYLAGVECDGAAYHSAATARDRDKVRAEILRGLGWQLLRVWSTDWWVDKAGATARLHTELQKLLGYSRQEQARLATTATEVNAHAAEVTATPASVRVADRPPGVQPVLSTYRLTDFGACAGNIKPDRFYEAAYDPVLRRLIAQVLDQEGPILDELLVQRIARAHGFARSGRLIQERVLQLAGEHHILHDDRCGGTFVWPDREASNCWATWRAPADETAIRQVAEISSQELRAAAAECRGDIAAEVARRFGIQRLTATARQRIEAACVAE